MTHVLTHRCDAATVLHKGNDDNTLHLIANNVWCKRNVSWVASCILVHPADEILIKILTELHIAVLKFMRTPKALWATTTQSLPWLCNPKDFYQNFITILWSNVAQSS